MRPNVIELLLAIALTGCQASGSVQHDDAGTDTSSDSGEDDCDWSWQLHPRHSPYLSGLWGRAGDDLWIFGPYTWQHYDGSSWSKVSYPGNGWQDRVHGDFDGSAWALVDHQLLRGNGTEFEPAAAFEPDGMIYPLAKDLFAREDSVYVVGYWSSEWVTAAMIARFDGEELEHFLPAVGSDSMDGLLLAVWGDADELFAVGLDGVVIHVDEIEISPMDTGVSGHALLDVSGVDGSDVYAAGYNGTVIHYDGTAWSDVDVPGLGDRNVYAVHATEDGDVFLAASAGAALDQVAVHDEEVWASAAIFERVGDTFVEMSPGFHGDPRGLWSDSGVPYVAGTRGGALLEVIEADNAWPLYFVPDIGWVNSLEVSTQGTVCAIGHWFVELMIDGDWQRLIDGDEDSHWDVAAAPDGRFWVASMNHDGDRPALWIADADGIQPADGIDHGSSHFTAVDVESNGDVWVAGYYGESELSDHSDAPLLVLVRREGEWYDVSPPDIMGYTWGLVAIDGHAFVSGSAGTLRYDGSEWSVIHDSADGEIGVACALAPDDVYADGFDGLSHWDGASFSSVSGTEGMRVFDADLDPDGNLWVAGDYGLDEDTAILLRRDESGWQTMIEQIGGQCMRTVAPLADVAYSISSTDFYAGEYVCSED